MQLTKRKLMDLWVVGRELTLDSDDDEPVTVWIQKMNAAETAEANRRCDAARARVFAARSNPDSDEWVAIEGSVREYSGGKKEPVVEFLLTDEKTKMLRRVELQLANEEPWSKDNYLQGLRDAWADGLQTRWLTDHEEDVEATRCKEELDRFVDAVTERVDDEIEVLRESWGAQSLGELEERMAFKLLEMDANQAWIQEMWACQVFYGTREIEDHKVRVFSDRQEVSQLAERTWTALHEAYSNLEVDIAEGKGSPAPTTSSPSLEALNEEETAESSGLVGANR